jgi:hypothetical protein
MLILPFIIYIILMFVNVHSANTKEKFMKTSFYLINLKSSHLLPQKTCKIEFDSVFAGSKF